MTLLSDRTMQLQGLHAAAQLARIPLSPTETAALAAELSAVREMLTGIDAIATDDIRALTMPHSQPAPARLDRILPSLPLSEALRNAPDSTHGFVRVTKVL